MKNKIFAALLLCVGLLLRIHSLPDMGQLAPYFETAYVSMEHSVPDMMHGGTQIYVQVLHGVLWLFGNKMIAGAILQLVLQVAAIAVISLAVRKICGGLQALCLFGVLMILPGMISGAVTLSPVALYLLIYGIALWLIAKGFEEESTLFWCILGGAAVGFAAYLDVMGFALLLVPIGIMLRDGWDKVKSFCLTLLISVVSFLICLGIEAMGSGSGLQDALSAWCGGVYGAELQNPLISYAVAMRWNIAFILLAVCVGIALDKFVIKEKTAFRTIQRVEHREEIWKERTYGMDTASNMTANTTENTVANAPEGAPVNYIENPLPIPKRHKRPMLDFDIDRLDGKDYYDIQVADDDDYDI